MENNNLTDWILDLPFRVFFWGLVAICFFLWSAAIIILLIYLHFAFPR